MRRIVPSRVLFAAGIIGMGILGVIYGKSAALWQPVPPWVPGREGLVYACGVLLLAGGVGLFFARTAMFASGLLSAYWLLWLLVLKAPLVVAAPQVIVSWESFGETAAMLAGAWISFATLADRGFAPSLQFAVGGKGLYAAPILFAVALLLFGLSHFGFAQFTATLVPAWLPWPLGWVYLTGIAYIAAGVGIIFRILPRLAAVLSAGMMGAFTLLIWIPGVVARPTDQTQWTELLISWTLAASAWIVARFCGNLAWFSLPWLSMQSDQPCAGLVDPGRRDGT